MTTLRRILALAILLASSGAGAVSNYHTGDTLICADCHTMHFSMQHGYQGGAVGTQATVGGDWLPAGGPNGHLLKLPPDQLCVACHDGTTVLAPDVVSPTSGDPAGGAFSSLQSQAVGISTGEHVLGTPLSMLSGPTRELGCSSCHSPHGSASFRNLRADPAGVGQDNLVVAHAVTPGDDTTLTSSARLEAAYTSSKILYESGMAGWCRSCHAGAHGHGETGSTIDHTDGAVLGDSPTVSIDTWLGAIDARVRTERPGGDGTPSPSDRVFCLTCHRAHGSGRRASLIFPDGDTLTSGCQQCHDE